MIESLPEDFKDYLLGTINDCDKFWEQVDGRFEIIVNDIKGYLDERENIPLDFCFLFDFKIIQKKDWSHGYYEGYIKELKFSLYYDGLLIYQSEALDLKPFDVRLIPDPTYGLDDIDGLDLSEDIASIQEIFGKTLDVYKNIKKEILEEGKKLIETKKIIEVEEKIQALKTELKQIEKEKKELKENNLSEWIRFINKKLNIQ
ncbi:MAG: hypothetical protein ACTSQE_10930 [Candidatus Heimdallarchaeaceae archaeon]